MPKKTTLLERNARKEIARIQFKPVVTIGGAYKMLGKSPFARDPTIYGASTTLTTGDGFYLVFHYPIRKVGKKLLVLTPDGEKDILEGGISDAMNYTFDDKRNVKALKTLRKAHLKFKTEYPSGGKIITIVTFTTLKPVAITIGVSKGKRRGVEIPPDLIYSVKDRDAIEESGIVIGKGVNELLKIEKDTPRLARDVVMNHKNLHTVYKFNLTNFKLVNNSLVRDVFDKGWYQRTLRLLRMLKDPLLDELATNFLLTLPRIAEKNGYTLPSDLKLYFAFSIPIGGTKGGFDVRILHNGKEIDLSVPNPNPSGRKKFIKAKSLLFYAPANEFLKHKHSKTKKSPKVDVLAMEHLLR